MWREMILGGNELTCIKLFWRLSLLIKFYLFDKADKSNHSKIVTPIIIAPCE